MYRFRSSKYLVTTSLMTALLFVVGYTSGLFFSWTLSLFLGPATSLQLFDALFIPLCAFFKGPMMLFAGAIAGGLFDLASGVRAVTIPVTILIRILMFASIKILTTKKWWSCCYSFLVAVLILIIGYPLYYLIIYQDQALVVSELLADLIQGGFAYVMAVVLYYFLFRAQLKSNYHLWDDHQFDHLKNHKLNGL